MKKVVAVLGARGFIGKQTVQYLSQNEQYRVLAVTRDVVNLLDAEKVAEYLENEKVDIIINCANQGGTRKFQNANTASADVIGNNLKMFFNMERCLRPGMKMINFGSGAQYNKSRDLIKVSEKDFGKVIPTDDYGYSKYVMSKYIKARQNMNECGEIYNPVLFGVFGVGEDYSFRFISNAIVKNILDMPIVINQDVVFDYLYIKDYFKVLDRILEDDLDNKEFNVTPSQSVSLTKIAALINEIGKNKSDITVCNEGFNFQYTGNNQILLDQLGKDFKFTSYRDSIGEMYDYYLHNLDHLDLKQVKEDALLSYCKTNRGGK